MKYLFIASALFLHVQANNVQNKKLLLASSLTGTGLTRYLPYTPKSNNVEKAIFKWFRTFSEAIHLIVKKHYKSVDVSSIIQDALKAALPKIDPHSSFFSKKSYKAAIESTSGKFSGVGVSIMNKAPEDDSLVIIDIIQGGPAYKAGLQPGDKIVGVNNESLKGLSSDEVITKLRGKTGTKVTLKILRKKKPLSITITRQVIKDQNLICYHFENQNIYYMALKLFAENTHRQMTNLLRRANKSNCNGIIIDLRRNPGGILDSAVDMVGLFVDKGSLVVTTRDRNNRTLNTYNTHSKPIRRLNKPIFIIIDNFTASASEIFAGCLRHYSNQNHDKLSVFLVGTETFGKGSVQEVIPISNGCAIKITTLEYFVAGKVPIQAKGIKPDFVIQSKVSSDKDTKWVKEMYGKESSLKNHIPAKGEPVVAAKPQPLGEQSKEELAKNWEQRYQESLANDTQVQSCINMINLLNLTKKTSPNLVKTRSSALDFLKKNYLTDKTAMLKKVVL